LPLYPTVKLALLEWVYKYESQIKQNNGYILFSVNHNRNKKFGSYVSPNWLRGEFRRVCKLINLDETYGYSDESLHNTKRERKLYRLTTHSFRHYFGTKLANSGVPIQVIKSLMRHQSLNSTNVYLNTTPNDMIKAVNRAFETLYNPSVTPHFPKNWSETKQRVS
jgi:integrase/recombinase XerC